MQVPPHYKRVTGPSPGGGGGLKMRTNKYSEATGKHRPINIHIILYIPEDSPSWKPQGLSQILLSTAMCLLTMSTLVIIQKERAVYGCFLTL